MPKIGGYGIQKARLKKGGGASGMGPFGVALSQRAALARRTNSARAATPRFKAAARKRAATRR